MTMMLPNNWNTVDYKRSYDCLQNVLGNRLECRALGVVEGVLEILGVKTWSNVELI
jgi:hypothetical protein